MKIKIEIKNRWTGKVLFEFEKEDNTVKDTLIEAVKNGAYLGGADLRGANLDGADLSGADLGGADLDGADLSGANLGGAYLRGAYLRGAYLSGADLGGADLRGADLGDADLDGADLGGAYLGDAYLDGADLSGANLGGADLRGANLRGAYLGGADLGDADLGGADLRGANLRGAYLGGADLRDAKNIPFIPISCPSDGAFIGWKKVDGYLVKLEIPADARRCSATGTKCRCDKALVVEIRRICDGEQTDAITNTSYNPQITYKVGKMVFPDSFDEDRWNECSHGIHFFINKQDAIDY